MIIKKRPPADRAVSRTVRLATVALVLIACGGEEPNGPRPADGLQVLFIGNSLTYSNDLPGILQAMFAYAGEPLRVASVTPGGVGLEDHWVSGEAVDSIRRGGWDVVVMQQGPSATEGRPSLLEYSKRFAEEIRRVGAEPAMYMVWPAEVRSFDFDGVSDSYRTAAAQIDGLLFPAGEAWRAAWRRDASIDLYDRDRFHPSQAGSYLAALVMYQQLSGNSPLGVPASLDLRLGQAIRIPAEWAPELQEAAAEANEQFARQAVGAP